MGRRAISIFPRDRQGVAANDTERQSSARLDPLIDTVVKGRFHIQRVLARGGMGRVYFATQEPLGRPVALKVVRDDAGAGAMRSQERFLVEAEILSRLQHPNVVTLHDFGELDGAHRGQSFIAMEFLDGETLADRVLKNKRLDAMDLLGITVQIVRGLRAAHERGIVHRDLKPANILVVPDADGEVIVKLVDFGIGKLFGDSDKAQDLTIAGEAVGTPQFMAPEQLDGQTRPASDLYAVGAIMFRALTGVLPFDSGTGRDTLRSKLSCAAPRLREAVPDLIVTERLESLVAALLERDPADRPSASRLLKELEACRRELEVRPAPRLSLVEPLTVAAEMATHQQSTSRSDAPASSAMSAMSAIAIPMLVPEIPSATHGLEGPGSRIARLTPYIVGALMLYGLALVYGFGRHDTPLRDATVHPAASGVSLATAPTSFSLVVESVPSGATVTEDGRMLGVTPLSLVVEHASVGQAPRHVHVQKLGYAAVSVEQGPSQKDARLIVTLPRLLPPSPIGSTRAVSASVPVPVALPAPVLPPPVLPPPVLPPTPRAHVFSTE